MRFAENEKVLVTCALPYVNNIPHLGNLVPIVSADVYVRFLKQQAINAVYICATDEHGTRTEIEAKRKGISPERYCLDLHKKIKDIFDWINVDFEYFGRTSDKENHELTQSIFLALYKNGFISSDILTQLYCSDCGIFLPDTFVKGKCPYCNNPDTNGDQCDLCGKFLDPVELLDPVCKTCQKPPTKKESRHLFLDLPKLSPLLEKWLKEKDDWNGIISQLPLSWIKKGLKKRCITRDLEWGIKVPLENYENKVFYVWFDAPIGYIGSTVRWASLNGLDWKSWWKGPDGRIIHFLGKDNVPFHTLMWPGSLLGANDGYNLPFYISANEYLNYEGGRFSKSRNRGIFSDQISMLGFPCDFWRFYLIRKRPEKTDTDFSWEDFVNIINTDLIQNFANYVNRTLKFTYNNYGYIPSEHGFEKEAIENIKDIEQRIKGSFFDCNLRNALTHILSLCDYANKYYQDKGPWKTIKEDDIKARKIVFTSILLLYKITNYLRPIIPDTCRRIYEYLGISQETDILDRNELKAPAPLFSLIDKDHILSLTGRFSGGAVKDETVNEWAEFYKDERVKWDCVILQFKGVEIRKKISSLQKLKKDIIDKIDTGHILSRPYLKKYYEAFEKYDRGQAVPSPVNLINIVEKSGNIPNINSFVDIYNLLSLKYGVVMGAYDRKAIKGRVLYKVADGSEIFIPVKNKQNEPIYPGEWVIADESGMVITRMLSKQAEAVAVDRESRDIIVCVQGNPEIDNASLVNIAKELSKIILEYCKGEYRILHSPPANNIEGRSR